MWSKPLIWLFVSWIKWRKNVKYHTQIQHTKRMCLMPKSGFQSFFNVLTQISPLVATLGWKILVMKKAFGGVCGKSLPKTSFTRKNPPAYGVPAAKTQQNTTWLQKSIKVRDIVNQLALATNLGLQAQLECRSHRIRWFVLWFLRVHLCEYHAFLLPLAGWFVVTSFLRLMTASTLRLWNNKHIQGESKSKENN